ncbi:MAG: DUF948 domain-containing protein [Pegethrix bostrychoides GSE-TBD4-15B]|uniref:DUF948 domain-containing protein n=1 Tax=Pegethrix bostrychoides GSE-TBD4-15B TaxID=2839662 RepID=A0A951PEW5_9CYAN|nr:DUF948 domain-containing protein [Pegethrix bostrychoides GSE-TBD4-15B]
MTDPVVWLGASLFLVAASLALLLVAALPAIQEVARAARSAEKLFDILSRDLPPTLEAIRLTGTELTGLTDDVSQNVQAASRVVTQFDQSLSGIKQQAQQAELARRSFSVGIKAAWKSLMQPRSAESHQQPDSLTSSSGQPLADQRISRCAAVDHDSNSAD